MMLFLNPPGKELHQRSSRWGGRINRSGVTAPPIFLATAASVARDAGIKARVLDAAAEGLTCEKTIEWIQKNRVDVVVFDVSTTSIDNDAKLAEDIKRIGCVIVFVGTHVTALPEEALMEYKADYVCFGEYEFTLPELFLAIRGKKRIEDVKGIAFIRKNKVMITDERELRDLDDFPIPSYDHLPIKKYYDPVARNLPWIAIRSMRGCPFGCTFCVAPQLIYKRTVRFRNPKKIIDEIELLVNRFGVNEFFIDDETFTINRTHLFGICEEIKKRGIKKDWVVFSRCDTINEEKLKELKSAGCYMIKYGLESADQNILDKAEKGIKVEMIRKSFEMTKKFGMKIHATVMLGLEGETKNTIRNTLEFVKSLDPDYVQYAIATPYPGTKWFKSLEKREMIKSRNWEDFDGSSKSVVKLDGMNTDELSQIIDYAYRDFYFRPKYIFKKLISIRSINELFHAMKSGLILLRNS